MSTCNEGAKQGENLTQFLFSLNKDLEFFFLKWTTVHDLATCLSSGSAGH